MERNPVIKPLSVPLPLKTYLLYFPLLLVLNLNYVLSYGHASSYGYGQLSGYSPNTRARVYAISSGYKPLSEFLQSLLLEGYEKRIRPFFRESPLEVHVNTYIIDLLHVDEDYKEITFDLFLREYWIDPRLAFVPRPNIGASIHLDPEHSKMVWQPDTFVVNERKLMFHEDTVQQEWIRIRSDGEVRKSVRRALTAYCYMGFHYYPFDRHRCDLELESFSYTTEEIQYDWIGGTITPTAAHVAAGIAVNATNGTHVPFRVMSIHANKYYVGIPSGNFSRLSVEITIQRFWGVYVSKFFVPSFLFVIVGLISLWIRHVKFAFILNIINLLFYHIFLFIPDIGAVVPYTQYYKANDIYRVITLIFLWTIFFMALAILLCYKYEGETYETREPKTYVGVIETEDLNPDPSKTRSFLEELSSRNIKRFRNTGTQTFFQSAISKLRRLCRIMKWVLSIGFLIVNGLFWFFLIILSEAYKLPEQLVLIDNDL